MTALHERLQDVIADMRAHANNDRQAEYGEDDSVSISYVLGWADRLEAATALQSSGGEVVFGYVGAFSADLMKKSTNADHNGSAEVWMRRRSAHDIPLYASPAQPSGFVLVPVEPTEAMLDAACAQHKCVQGDPWYHDDPLPVGDAEAIWAAMLSAAPIEQAAIAAALRTKQQGGEQEADEDGLPDLPFPALSMGEVNSPDKTREYFTGKQMRLYALAALRTKQPAVSEGDVAKALQWVHGLGVFAEGCIYSQFSPPQGIHDTIVNVLKAANTSKQAAGEAVDRLQSLAACAYQLAGYHDAPEIWLDRLGQAANGDDLPDADALMDELLPYRPDTTPPRHPADEGRDARGADLYAAIERACEELPDGWQIEISLEKDAGSVSLTDPDGEAIEIPSDDYNIDVQVNSAIAAALQAGTP